MREKSKKSKKNGENRVNFWGNGKIGNFCLIFCALHSFFISISKSEMKLGDA